MGGGGGVRGLVECSEEALGINNSEAEAEDKESVYPGCGASESATLQSR